ncbi:MAG: hypothetical protein WAK48_14820 [Candidatus Acidiferrum sp.]
MNRSRRSKSISACIPSLSPFCFAATIAISVLAAGCAEHDSRIYDPYYSDYRVWNNDEVGCYQRWAVETHRDPNRDFRKIPAAEQKEYWTWRHNNSGNEHH